MSGSFPNSTLATVDRPLRLRMRPDLQIAEQWFGGKKYYVTKDPLTVVFSYLTEHEYFILALLDGEFGTAEIQREFQARFAPQQVNASQLQAFLSQLHRNGLVLAETPGQGEQLERRRQSRRQFALLRWAEQLLAIRWRGINPQPLLDWLEPTIGWLFSRWGFVLWLSVVLLAVAVVLSHMGEFARRLPEGAAWLTGSNLLLLGSTLIVVKSWHELGHALAARRLGCQCREIGIQFFFLVPCLYTNVSEVWLIPSKWRRIAVSAAGIYVELLLAAIAALVWWQAEPGLVSSLCQSVILVASIGTLLLNGNPLMRYDGYYILADLVEVPNLEQRSRSQLVAWLARWCVGIDWKPAEEFDYRPRPLLAAYAGAALVYRTTVLIGVYLASRAILRPLHAEPLSDVLIAGAAVGVVMPLATTSGQLLMQAQQNNELRPARLIATAVVLIGAIAAACFVPLPQRVKAPVVIEPRDASRIYATVPGLLQDAPAAGTMVQAGEPIVHLENFEQRRNLARLEAEHQQQTMRVVELETLRGEDSARAAAIPTARQSLADLDARLGEARRLIGRLTLRAPHDGVVLPPPNRRARTSSRELTGWSGTPLDAENGGALIETGTMLCLVAKPGDLEAVAVIDQADAPLVQPGRRVNIAVSQWRNGIVAGTVEQVAQIDADELPPHLAAIGDVPQQRDVGGTNRTLRPSYQVRIRLNDPPASLLPGAVGRVLIVAPPQPLATRVMRWLSHTFRFRSARE